MKEDGKGGSALRTGPQNGLAARLAIRLMDRLRGPRRLHPRLELVDRIALAPRQSLALVEAEGRRFLVATSADSSPAFYPLDGRSRPTEPGPAQHRAPRVSW